MAVIPNDPPLASRAELASLFPAGSLESPAAAPAALMPHRAFVMTAESAAARAHPAEEASYIGWRYVMTSLEGPGVATVAEYGENRVHRFAAHDLGPYANVAPAAIQTMTAYAAGIDRNFELRFLGLPALFVEAVWLRDVSGAEDLFLPFGLVPDGLSADAIYPLDGWREQVGVLADRALAIAARFGR